MKHMHSIIPFALLLGVDGSRATSRVTPVQKVIQLLEGMKDKGIKDKHNEEVQFAAYKQFCEDTATEKKLAIEEGDMQIEQLEASIEKGTAKAGKLAEELASHEGDVSVWKGDVKAITAVRQLDKTDFDATQKDLSESVDALRRAIEVLKKQDYDRKQAESLLQLSTLRALPHLPAGAKDALDAFLVQLQGGVGETQGAPEANAYEFQSGGVIAMLEKLLEKFQGERKDLEQEEKKNKNAFELVMQDLADKIALGERMISEKTKTRALTLQQKADDEGSLVDTKETRAADQTYLTELVATCQTKATDFESRQTLRSGEIEAIEKAVDILASNSVSGNADKHLPKLVQTRGFSSFAQVRASGDVQKKVAQYLQLQAHKLSSRLLSATAAHAKADPFQKVIRMLKDLITRLMEEANEEVTHKGWCDTELGTNAQTREQKTTSVEELHANIDELGASIAKLTADIADLTQQVADLDKAMSEATDLRQKEKATNQETIKDAGEANEAVEQALVVLREFYAKAAEATAFLDQRGQPEAPEIFDSPYKGMQDGKGGVVSMLEVISADFLRLSADTQQAETKNQAEYDAFMTDSKVDKAAKSKDIEHKTAKVENQEATLVEKKTTLEGTQKELDAALDYYEKLKPTCVDDGNTYEDRVARRKEEIESLQEALRILNGEE